MIILQMAVSAPVQVTLLVYNYFTQSYLLHNIVNSSIYLQVNSVKFGTRNQRLSNLQQSGATNFKTISYS